MQEYMVVSVLASDVSSMIARLIAPMIRDTWAASKNGKTIIRVLLLLKMVMVVTVSGASKSGFYASLVQFGRTVVVKETEKRSVSSQMIQLSSTRIDETKEGIASVRTRVRRMRVMSFFPSSRESLERTGALQSQIAEKKGYSCWFRMESAEFRGRTGMKDPHSS